MEYGIKDHFKSAATGAMSGTAAIALGFAAVGGFFLPPEQILSALGVAVAGLGGGLALATRHQKFRPITSIAAFTTSAALSFCFAYPVIQSETKQFFEDNGPWSTVRDTSFDKSGNPFCRARLVHPGWKVLCKRDFPPSMDH